MATTSSDSRPLLGRSSTTGSLANIDAADLSPPSSNGTYRSIESTNSTAPVSSFQIAWYAKWLYGLGAISYSMISTIPAFFLNAFLLDVAQLPPSYAGTILLISKIWDAITDPLVGYLANRTRTAIGRYRPWILASALPSCFFSFMLFQTWPSFMDSNESKFWYYLLMLCGVKLFFTAFFIPYTAVIMRISTNDAVRNQFNEVRFLFMFVSIMGGLAMMGSLVTNAPHDRDSQAAAFTKATAITNTVAMACIIICGVGIRENTTEDKQETKERAMRPACDEEAQQAGPAQIGLVRLVLSNRIYLQLTCIACLSWLGLAIVQNNLLLFVKYALGMAKHFTTGIITVYSATFLSIPLWRRVSARIGKRSTFMVGTVMMAIALIFFFFVPKANVAVFYPACAFAGIGLAVLQLLPWMMLPDAIDQNEVRFGQRQEGIFFSLFVFAEKIAAGLSLSASNFVLSWYGYDSDDHSSTQPEPVQWALRSLIGVASVFFLALAFVLLIVYPIGKADQDRIQRDITAYRKRKDQESQALEIKASNVTMMQQKKQQDDDELKVNLL